VFGARFSLFADVLLVGVLTFVASLPVVTAYAALVAACRAVSAAADGGPVSVPEYGRTFVAVLRSHPGVLGFPLLLALDVVALAVGAPGGPALAVGLVAVALVGLVAAASWAPGRAWPAVLRHSVLHLVRRPGDAALLLAAMVVAGVLAVAVPLMIALVPGVLALAAVAVSRRRSGAGRAGTGSAERRAPVPAGTGAAGARAAEAGAAGARAAA